LSIIKIIKKTKPNEIYNLAAQSHVSVSFQVPEYTADVDALGTLRILDAIKILNFKNTRYYQAGTSEMFGKSPPPQNEKTTFLPQSPYAVAKLYAHHITVCYRESYKIFACNGIMFNHESPFRGETFVTKKIISGLVKIKYGRLKKIYLGNLYSKRDWGHAEDYVEAMWKMLQMKYANDYVIATNNSLTVKQFINMVAKELGMNIQWKGKKLSEKCFFEKNKIIEIDKNLFRPSEVDHLRGDFIKARKILKWRPKKNIRSLIKEMIIFEKNLLNVKK
jgi:GDPmannose 4,6-dehydratase